MPRVENVVDAASDDVVVGGGKEDFRSAVILPGDLGSQSGYNSQPVRQLQISTILSGKNL